MVRTSQGLKTALWPITLRPVILAAQGKTSCPRGIHAGIQSFELHDWMPADS